MTKQHALLCSSILVGLSLIAAGCAFRTWLIRYRRTRETFAMWVVLCAAALLADLILSLGTFMPWQIPAAWLQRLLGEEWVPHSPHPAEYVLAVFMLVIAYRSSRHSYDNWDGERSLDHHRRAERGERGSLVADGLSGVLRLLTGGPIVEAYKPVIQHQNAPVLETVNQTSAWKDEARELVRLGTSSYFFDSEAAWHDAQDCWVGTNTKTHEPVFLFPRHKPPTDDDLRKCVAYSQKLAKGRSPAEVEIIVAVETPEPERQTLTDKFITLITREELLDRLVDFTDYRNGIIRRVQLQHLPDSNLTLPDVYVPSRFMRGDDVAIGDAETYLREWLSESSQRQVAMLGGYGQGKSTTALMFTYNLLTAPRWSKARIPIFIELRGTSPRNLTPLQLFGAWTSQYNINAQALLKLHIAGRLLLIFEGFDEMSLVGDAEMRLKHFRVLWQFCYERAKIVITGRPNFFLDDNEMRLALGIHVPTVGRPYCDAVRLASFGPEQIRASLRAHPLAVRDGIPPLVESNQRFADLVSRPALLHIVAVLWEKERLYEQLDKLNSAYVMALFVRHSYTRQGRKESHSPDFMALTTPEREYFMQGIAAYMVANGLPNQIQISSLNQLIEDLIAAAPPSLSVTDALSGDVLRPLSERVAEGEYGIDHVKTDVRACGLLVDDPAASGTFRFGHKSFMEYIFATVVADRVVNDSTLSRTLLRVANARIGDILHLPVAVEFLSELVEGWGFSSDGLSPKDQEKAFAIRLLSATLDQSGLMFLFERFRLFQQAHRVTTMRLPTVMGILAVFSSPVMFVMSLMMVLPLSFWVLVSPMHRNASRGGSLSSSDFGAMIFFMGITMTMLMVFTIVMRSGNRLRAAYALWNLLCKRLSISDDVLHRIAGTHWLPWARHHKFDYFLADLEDIGENRSQVPNR